MATGDRQVFKNDEAPAWLAHLDIIDITYTTGDMTRIDYEDTAKYTGNYEIFAYSGTGELSTIQHYINAVLIGTTTLSYTADVLTSVVYTVT